MKATMQRIMFLFIYLQSSCLTRLLTLQTKPVLTPFFVSNPNQQTTLPSSPNANTYHLQAQIQNHPPLGLVEIRVRRQKCKFPPASHVLLYNCPICITGQHFKMLLISSIGCVFSPSQYKTYGEKISSIGWTVFNQETK